MIDFIKEPRSLNNRLILEKYVKEGLRADTSSNKGFAMIAQKTQLKGLKVLISAKLADGTVIAAGSKAYIKEEALHSAPWAAKVWECDSIDGQFMIVDIAHVEFVKHD